MKMLVSRESIEINPKGLPAFTRSNPDVIQIYGANKYPRIIADWGDGLWDRLYIMRIDEEFKEGDENFIPDLMGKLRDELPQIVYMAMKGTTHHNQTRARVVRADAGRCHSHVQVNGEHNGHVLYEVR